MKKNTNIADCLAFNNKFASERLTADQLGAAEHKNWIDTIADLHKSAYKVAVFCENNHANVSDTVVDKTALYTDLRKVIEIIGAVNGRVLFANDAMATLIIGYANRRANCDSPDLQLVCSQISNAKRTLALYETTKGVSPDAIEDLKKQVEELSDKKDELIGEAGNRYKTVTRTNFNAFRLDVEHLLARAITEQNSKSWEQLEAEAEARKAARRAKTKAKKSANKTPATK